MSSPELPLLRIQKQISDGRCGITYICQPRVLEKILAEANAATPADLSEDFLRQLCRHASSDGMDQVMEQAESTEPGGANLIVVIGNENNERLELQSAELGFDLVKRLTPEQKFQETLLCDPDYSPIDLEIRVFDTSLEASTDAARNVGRCVLRTTLQPPSLA